eukprot:g11338.t1
MSEKCVRPGMEEQQAADYKDHRGRGGLDERRMQECFEGSAGALQRASPQHYPEHEPGYEDAVEVLSGHTVSEHHLAMPSSHLNELDHFRQNLYLQTDESRALDRESYSESAQPFEHLRGKSRKQVSHYAKWADGLDEFGNLLVSRKPNPNPIRKPMGEFAPKRGGMSIADRLKQEAKERKRRMLGPKVGREELGESVLNEDLDEVENVGEWYVKEEGTSGAGSEESDEYLGREPAYSDSSEEVAASDESLLSFLENVKSRHPESNGAAATGVRDVQATKSDPNGYLHVDTHAPTIPGEVPRKQLFEKGDDGEQLCRIKSTMKWGHEDRTTSTDAEVESKHPTTPTTSHDAFGNSLNLRTNIYPFQLYKPLDLREITWIDTPGHALFELMRGRTTAVADVAVVLFDVTKLNEQRTEELLLHVEKWQTPAVFVLNKVDLLTSSKSDVGNNYDALVCAAKAALVQQCRTLNESGVLAYDWTACAEKALPMSALKNLTTVRNVIDKVHEVAAGSSASTPVSSAAKQIPPAFSICKPGTAKETAHYTRRTDLLTGIDLKPFCLAQVLEVERSADRGTLITLLVKYGKLGMNGRLVSYSSRYWLYW